MDIVTDDKPVRGFDRFGRYVAQEIIAGCLDLGWERIEVVFGVKIEINNVVA